MRLWLVSHCLYRLTAFLLTLLMSTKTDNMTEQELCALPIGTPVRIKATALASPKAKKGGTLVIQPRKCVDKNEYRCGIKLGNYVCYGFRPKDYELIPQ